MSSLADFKIKDIYQEDNNIFRGSYENGDKILKAETISNTDQFTANQYITANIAQTKGLFTDALAPYPGVASNTIVCEPEYKPIFDSLLTTDKLEVSYFIAYLNNNLTYGSCTKSQTIYKGISAYFYCQKNKQAYHIEIIAPKASFEESAGSYTKMVQSIKCN